MQEEMENVPLNIVMTYPVHWSRYQVLRDFVQNFYDSVGYDEWEKKFQYTYKDNILTKTTISFINYHFFLSKIQA